LTDFNTTAVGNFAVNSLIKSVIAAEAGSGGKQGFDFVIPESYQYFYNELLTFYLTHPHIRIRHIMAFSKKTDFLNNLNRNLDLLSHVLPFAFAPATGYFPYYYYSNSLGVELTQAMPYFILTSSNTLVLINKEFSKAALICDESIVDLYKESFSMMLEHAKPLINYFANANELLVHLLDTDLKDTGEPYHWIEPEPCIGPMIPQEMIENHVSHDLPDRDSIVRMINAHCQFLRHNQLRNVNICTTDGLYHLINSGYIYQASKELMTPLGRDEIKGLLCILCNRISEKKVKILFTNPSKITVPGKTLLSINRKTGLNFMLHNSDIFDFRAICLSEDTINEAFTDFIESIEESGLVYSENDSVETLSRIISEI